MISSLVNSKQTKSLQTLIFMMGVWSFLQAQTQIAESTSPKEEVVAAPSISFENSLNMKFVSIPGLDVYFSIYETRVMDYLAYVSENYIQWRKPDFHQEKTEPAVNVKWEDAVLFCRWLTDRDQKKGLIGPNDFYRLPTSDEWSAALGVNSHSSSPEGALTYYWGNDWPPPRQSGNFDPSLGTDDFKYTAPVGSFKPNVFGLYDMEGNVREWCMDKCDASDNLRKIRGSSWRMSNPTDLKRDQVIYNYSGTLFSAYGFRCVFVKEKSSLK